MNKKILLLGFLFVLLLAIPLTVFLVGKQTKTTTKAAKSTNLSFSQLNAPVNVSQGFNLDVIMDPGSNQVSFVKLVVAYDPAFLKPNPTGGHTGLQQNKNIFQVTLEDQTTTPNCTGSTCTLSLSMAIDPASGKPVQGAPATIASVYFTPLAPTVNASTTVRFYTGTQVLSLSTADAPSENVLSSSNPTTISIVGPTPSPSPDNSTPTPTIDSSAATPTTGTAGSGSGEIGNTTATPTISGGSTQSPICTALTADKTSSASAPLAVLFTTTGADPAGTISKVTLNFGDGTVQDLTTAGGIGTNSVNSQVSHTYQANGLYSATATLTDNNGNISTPSTCSQTITIGTNIPTATPTPAPVGTPKTGPGDTFMIIGAVGAMIAVVGGALLFGL